jgi:peptidoglycan/LPS O-acetylase OafA/YrhL
MGRQYGALSGVAIGLIVLNHAVHFGLELSSNPGPDGIAKAAILLQAMGAFAVPTFLFVSGAFLSYAGTSLSGLAFWYAVAPVLIRVARRHAVALVGAIAAYQITLLASRFSWSIAGAALPSWVDALRLPVLFTPMSEWGVYLPLGVAVGLHASFLRQRLQGGLRHVAWVAAAVFFMMGILDAYGLVSAPWARFAAPVPLMFVLAVMRRDSIPFFRAAEVLGRQSYGIYLTHFVILNAILYVAAGMNLNLSLWLTVPFLVATGLGGSWLLMQTASRTRWGRRLCRPVFGIAPPVRRDDVRPAWNSGMPAAAGPGCGVQ